MAALGRSTAGPVKPMSDKYAFHATDEQTNKHKDVTTAYSPRFCGGSLTSGAKHNILTPVYPHSLGVTTPLTSSIRSFLDFGLIWHLQGVVTHAVYRLWYPPQSITDVWLTFVSMLIGATCCALFVCYSTTLIKSFAHPVLRHIQKTLSRKGDNINHIHQCFNTIKQ